MTMTILLKSSVMILMVEMITSPVMIIMILMIINIQMMITSPVMTGRVRKRPEAAPGMRLG